MIEVKVTGVPEDFPKKLQFVAYVWAHTVDEFEQVLAGSGATPERVPHDPTALQLPAGDGYIKVGAPYEIEATEPAPKSTPRTRFIDGYLSDASKGDAS